MPHPVSATARSPLSGCAILISAVVMLVFLIGFTIWIPFRQAAEMEKFTEAEPTPLPVDPIEGNETAVNALVERLESFRSVLSDEEKEARLRLSANDLNLAIAAFPVVEELRGSFRVREIKDDELVIDICYRLNGRPRLTREDEEGTVTADPRYLIGTIHGHPMLSRREIVLKVDRLDVPGAEVPEGFMGHFSTLRLFEQKLEDPNLGPVFAKLTRAEIDGDQLVIARVPGEPLPDVITDEQFQKGGGKVVIFLGAAAVVFLVLAGSVLFIGYRTQLRKLEAEERQTNSGDPDA